MKRTNPLPENFIFSSCFNSGQNKAKLIFENKRNPAYELGEFHIKNSSRFLLAKTPQHNTPPPSPNFLFFAQKSQRKGIVGKSLCLFSTRLLSSWRYGVSAKLKYFYVLTSRLCLSKKAIVFTLKNCFLTS
jgi:hypothetical protein